MILVCAECGTKSKGNARDWRALLTDGEFEPEEVATYCPDCARYEFDDYSTLITLPSHSSTR
jgi:hypothetical protein